MVLNNSVRPPLDAFPQVMTPWPFVVRFSCAILRD